MQSNTKTSKLKSDWRTAIVVLAVVQFVALIAYSPQFLRLVQVGAVTGMSFLLHVLQSLLFLVAAFALWKWKKPLRTLLIICIGLGLAALLFNFAIIAVVKTLMIVVVLLYSGKLSRSV